ncbi:MAG: (2Fe-2S) ferredoxin domain-containing protein [Cyanobium sp.]
MESRSEPPCRPRIAHHLLLCATASKALCCDPKLGARSWETLKRLIRQEGLEDPRRPGGIVLRTKADCLRICQDGPVLLIWPEGTLYTRVDPERIERIVREHLIEGRPIEAWIQQRLQWRLPGHLSQQEPPPGPEPGPEAGTA